MSMREKLRELLQAAYLSGGIGRGWSVQAEKLDDILTDAAALRATTGEGECEHDWVSGDNQYVSNASVCRKCGRIEPTDKLAAPPPPLRDAGAVDAAALGRLAQDAWMDAHDDYPAWGFLSETERAAWLAVGERIARALSARPAPAQVDETAVERLANHLRKQMIYRCMKPSDIRANAREYLTAAAKEKNEPAAYRTLP